MARVKAVPLAALIASGSICAGACLGAPVRVCEFDVECRLDGRQGNCQAEGLCAYPDEGCPTGARYGLFAGELADACVPDCAEVSPDASCRDEPSCPVACEVGDPILLATWNAPSGRVVPQSVAADAGRVAITGSHDGELLLLLMGEDGSVRVETPPAGTEDGIGRAIGFAPDGTIWLALEQADGSLSRSVLLRVGAAGEIQESTGFGTLGIQRVLAMAVDDAGSATIVGTHDDAPWIERRALDGTLAWTTVWDDGFTPADLGVSGGGQAAVLGVTVDGAAVLRRFDAHGAAIMEAPLEAIGGLGDAAVSLSGAGAVVAGQRADGPWIASLDAAGFARWTETLDSTLTIVDIEIDDRGWTTVLGTSTESGSLVAWMRQYDDQGGQRWNRILRPEDGTPVALTLDPEQRPIALGLLPSGSALWVRRFEP